MSLYYSNRAVMVSRCRLPVAVFAIAVLVFLPSVVVAASLATDQPEYAPGETVRIRGAGFGSAEVITLQVSHVDGDPAGGEGHDPWDVMSNGSGGFLAEWIVPYDDNVAEELRITATGQVSGTVATTTILDANTHLLFTSIPASVPPSSVFSVTANLTQDCGGDPDEPLAGRTLLFFITEGNCGVDVGQTPNATGITDAFGDATVSLTAPAGAFGIRVKFLGEDKPDPCPNPGNSACDPSDPNSNKRCVALANANLCQTVSATTCDPLVSICPPDVTVSCESSVPSPDPASVLCSGGCSPVTTSWVGDGPLVGGPCGGTIARTYRCTDAFGNTADCIQTITVDDNTAPFFPSGCDFASTVQCISQVPNPGLAGVGPIDNCDVSLTVTHVRTDNGGAGCVDDPRIIADTYTATDDCGNSGACQRVWTVIDDTPPTITCPPGFSVECLADIQACNPQDASASDNCGAVSVTCSDGPLVGGSCGGTVTRTFVATDECGNSAMCTQIITVDDTTPPSIACPPDFTIPCGGTVPPCDPGAATAFDNCGVPTVTCADAPISTGVIRTFTATDACGNSASCAQIITFDDDTPPEFVDCPPSFTVSCIADVPPCPTAMPVVDECLGLIVAPATCVDGPLEGGPCGGTITRTITVSDEAGNVATCTQIITVDDNMPPAITCPSALTLQCGESTDPSNTGMASATDNCDPNPDLGYSDAVTAGSCAHSYTITRTWTATDYCGNVASCDHILTVVDTKAPTITCPADAVVECGDPYDPSATGTATADDACDPAPMIDFTDAETPGACPQEKSIVRTWTAIDACGNATSCVQMILIEDTQPPVISGVCGDGGVFQCEGDVPDSPPASVLDDCDPAVTVSVFRSDNGGSGCASDPLIITDSYSATDACGNTATCTRTYTVADNTPPVFTNGCGVAATYQCASEVPPPDASIMADDNCDGALATTVVRTSNGGGGCSSNPLILTDTYTAVDDCGNQSQCARTHTVVDNTPPTFVQCPPNSSVEGLENLPECDGSDVVATDNCGPVTITCTRAGLGGVGCGSLPINVTYTYTATDGCGNSATCLRVVTVYLPPCNFFVSLGSDGDQEVSVPLGSQIEIPLRIDSIDNEVRAVDFAFSYDPSIFTLLGVTRGEALAYWKYFTYENGRADQSGGRRVSIKAVADPDGAGGIPSNAFSPIGVVATLNFAISPEGDNEGRQLSIAPIAEVCDDNCLLSRDGTIAYISAAYTGAPCSQASQVIPAVRISAARTRIVAPVDSRGDLNLNGTAYEVGDAVLLVEYLSGNQGVFSANPFLREMQFEASDVNGDGVRMAVSDLVYMIRVISGEVPPDAGAKLSAHASDVVIETRIDDAGLHVSIDGTSEVGGVLLTFRSPGMILGAPEVSEAAAMMEMHAHTTDQGELKVLVYGWDHGARIAAGRNELFTLPVSGNGSVELVGIDVSDADGALLNARQAGVPLPQSYQLLQNYPNPFNAGTVIPFVIKDASQWTLAIYNILGQIVWTSDGFDASGTVRVNWNGQDRDGVAVPSGVYFYRVVTSTWSATKKMTILK